MTIRSWAGGLALVSTLLFGWGAGSALAKPAEKSAASSDVSYPLSLRGNAVNLQFNNDCTFCNVEDCSCISFQGGPSTYWQWGTNPYTVIGYSIEVDYLLADSTDSGTGGSCVAAVGGIKVDGTFTPNVLVAETTGTICDTPNGNVTYSGSYVITDDGAAGLYTDASGAGTLTFGIGQENISPAIASETPADINGQLQMTGNISLGTSAPSSCSAAGGERPAC
jgi:hypothetical protein